MQYHTIAEVAKMLNISKSTIYHNGPASYGGIKIGGAWRFPADKIGLSFEPKPKINTGYTRRFGKKKKAG
jgi:hypothetical protein